MPIEDEARTEAEKRYPNDRDLSGMNDLARIADRRAFIAGALWAANRSTTNRENVPAVSVSTVVQGDAKLSENSEPPETDATPDDAFELGRMAGYDEAMREMQIEPPADERECTCTWHTQKADPYWENVLEYEPGCPVHSEHLYDPREGKWVLRQHPITESERILTVEEAALALYRLDHPEYDSDDFGDVPLLDTVLAYRERARAALRAAARVADQGGEQA